VRPSPTAGQASLEYVAVISLVAALLLVAAPAVGAPSIANLVARGVRLGLCVVADDVCTREDAAEVGLPPCRLDSKTVGYDERTTVFSVELGSRDTLTGELESDGSVDLTWTGGVSAGLAYEFGGGAETPVAEVGVGGGAAARAKINLSRGWRFPDMATARRFIAGMPKSAADPKRWPATWHTVEGAAEVAAEAGQSAGAVDLAKIGISAADVIGARIGPGSLKTIYFNAGFEGAEVTLPGVPSKGHGRDSLIGELTLDGISTRAIALRHIQPSEQNNRLTETVYRVPLNGLRPPPPWKIDDQARFFGTIERNVYAYSDDTRGVSGKLGLGVEFGFYAKVVDIRRTLIDATARAGSDKDRSRFDCLDQLR
jgi:hypothetical protein